MFTAWNQPYSERIVDVDAVLLAAGQVVSHCSYCITTEAPYASFRISYDDGTVWYMDSCRTCYDTLMEGGFGG